MVSGRDFWRPQILPCKTKSGIAFVFTFGFFGIGWLIDAGLIPNLVHVVNIPLYQMESQVTATTRLV